LPPILSFDDQELAALRSAAAKLLPQQRDRFLRDVARELGRCREIGPDTVPNTVARVATVVQRRLANGDDARAMLPRDSRTSRGLATPLAPPADFLNPPR
jgi:hypothetical protein